MWHTSFTSRWLSESCCFPPHQDGDEDDADDAADKPLTSHPDADTTIIFMTGEGWFTHFYTFVFFCFFLENWHRISELLLFLLHLCLFSISVFITTSEFPANEIVRFLVGFTNKGTQDFTVQSLEASFRYPQDFQFYIQNVSLIMASDKPHRF